MKTSVFILTLLTAFLAFNAYLWEVKSIKLKTIDTTLKFMDQINHLRNCNYTSSISYCKNPKNKKIVFNLELMK